MTTWLKCIARYTPKATYTHSEYVIIIVFPLQQWLNERASMLRYMYIQCLNIKQVPKEADAFL